MKTTKKLVIIFTFIFLFLPIFILFVYSFNESDLNIVFTGFTTKWYKELFLNKNLLEAFGNTLIIAFLSTFISTAIGTLSAVAIKKYDFKGKEFLNKLLYIPIIIPEIVLGISLLSMYTLFKLELGIFTILLSHIAFSIPFVIVSVRSVLNSDVITNAEASYDLGANNIQTFFKVTLPNIRDGVKSGAVLAFTLSLDDVVISYFTAGPGSNTLPLKIYSIIKTGITPDVYALMTLMMFVITMVLVINTLLQFKKVRGYN